MKSFGVGCMHFSIADKLRGHISIQEYADEVVRVLELFTTITDVDIYFDEDAKNEKICVEPPNPQLQNGESCYPHIPRYNLEFKVYIPFRVQAALIGTKEKYVDTFTEKFKVYLKHDWYGPVSYIDCLGAKAESNPSTAVQVIREYLAKELNGLETFLKIDFVGPSPFHADFFLSADEDMKKEEGMLFHLDQMKKPGYDTLKFRYSTTDFDSEEIAFDVLMDELADELAFFYALNVREAKRIHNWFAIYENMHTILEFENKESKKKLKDKLFLRSKLFRTVFRDIGLFKGEDIFNKSLNEQHYASIYKSKKHNTYLQAYVDDELSDSQVYPIQETSDLLKYFDQKSSKSLELIVVFIAAIMGGIVGSLITVSFE